MRYESLKGSSSKFWDIELKASTLEVKWGRIGTAGQMQQKKFATPAKAQAEHDQLVAEKAKKGYRAAPVAMKPVREKESTKTVSSLTELFLRVSHHQFSLEDSKHTGQPFRFDSIDDGLEVQPYGMVAHLRRAVGRIPIAIEVRSDAPPAEFDAFHLVSEGSFEAPSGKLELASPEATWSARINVPAGWLRVQVRQADLDTSTYDGSEGADHYRIILWPAPDARTKVLLTRELKDDVIFKPKVKLDALQRQYASSDDTNMRCLAAVEAARHLIAGEKQALEVLRKALKDQSDAVRAVTLSALGVSGSAERQAVLELIDSRVGDQTAEVRERVPEALSRLKGKDGAAAMVALLRSKNGELATLAAQLMWTVTEHLDVNELLPLLGSKKSETRLAALEALKTLGGGRGWDAVAPAGAAVRALAKDRSREVKELASSLTEKLGAPVDELLAMAKGDTEQRKSAANSLGKSRSPEAYQPLLKMLHKDKEVGVRRTAAEGLGRLGDRRAVPELAKYLEDGTFNLNQWCAGALAMLGGPEATRELWKYTVIADADERFENIGRDASDGLANMLHSRAKVKAGENLNPDYDASPDLDDSVLQLSVLLDGGDDRLLERGLKFLKSSDDIEVVAAALSREREETMEQAIRTLSDLLSNRADKKVLARAAKAMVPHIEAMSKVKSRWARTEWFNLLGSTGSPLARSAVLAGLKDPEPLVRASAAHALGALGPDGALDELAPLLEDEANDVKRAAASAFSWFKKDKPLAKKMLTAFLKAAKGSVKSIAQESLQNLA